MNICKENLNIQQIWFFLSTKICVNKHGTTKFWIWYLDRKLWSNQQGKICIVTHRCSSSLQNKEILVQLDELDEFTNAWRGFKLQPNTTTQNILV